MLNRIGGCWEDGTVRRIKQRQGSDKQTQIEWMTSKGIERAVLEKRSGRGGW